MVKVTTAPLDQFVPWGEVLTSRDVVGRLAAHYQVNATAARARLARVADSAQVWRSEHVLLPHNNRLFARRGFRRTPGFYTAVAKVLETARPGLARCLQSLGRNRVIHELQARKLLAAPAAADGAFPGLECDLAALCELGVKVYQTGSHRFLGSEGLSSRDSLDEGYIMPVIDGLRRETLIARVLTKRLQQQNVLSWTGTNLPNLEQLGTDFNNQRFTAFGFSFLKPLLRKKPEKKLPTPCPVLIDVHAGECGSEHVRSFIHRAERAVLRQAKQHHYLGVIAARSFPEEAWNLARGQGLLAINLVQMFGDEALEAMAIAERLLGGFQAEPATQDFAALLASIENLKTNPVVVDLYSIGFEAFVGLALRDEGYEDVAFNTIVPFGNTKRDVDVYGRRKNQLVVIECKAYHANKELSPAEVKKFFTETVPGFVKWWSGRNGNRQPERVRAEIWTTGTIGPDAEAKLAELSLKATVDAKLCDQRCIEQGLSFEIKSRMGQLLSAIARGGEQGEGG